MTSPFTVGSGLRKRRSFLEAPISAVAPEDVTERGMRYYEHVRLPSLSTPLFVAEIGSAETEAP